MTSRNDEFMNQPMKAAELRVAQLSRVLPIRSELHLIRKLWHMATGLAIVSAYMSGISQTVLISVLGALFVWVVSIETIRLYNPALNEKMIRYFSLIIRSNEVNKVSGVPYYLASAIIAIAVFPEPVAILSLCYLVFGDPLASLVGIMYSHRSVKIFNGKSLHGSAAGFSACALVTWFYLRSTGMHGLDLIRLTLLGGFAGAVAELLPLELDDNFTIPIVSGFILWLGFIAINFV